MSGLGSFNSESLEKLKQEYAQQVKTAEDLETVGHSVGPNILGLETSPIPSVWASVKNWSYPSGVREPEGYDNDLDGVDFLTTEELQEIIDDLNSPSSLEEDFSEYIEEEEDDYGLMSLEEVKALSREYLDEYQEEEDDIDLDNMTAEQFDALIESILDEMGDDEGEEDEEEPDLDQLATLMLKELKEYDIDVLSLSEQDIYTLVEKALFGEEEDIDSLEEKLNIIEGMIKQIKEEI
jgi:hypothetical protein